MAACCLVPYAAEDVAAMRLVTSLTLVEEQLKRTVVVALIMGAAVLAFTIMSGPVLRAEHCGAAGTGGAHRRRHRPG